LAGWPIWSGFDEERPDVVYLALPTVWTAARPTSSGVWSFCGGCQAVPDVLPRYLP
jgi:hypothetical protein